MIHWRRCLSKLNLLPTSHQGQIGVQLHFRDLWSFAKHPSARALTYEFSSPISANTAIVRMTFLVCGSKLAVSLELSGGRFKHLILNWLNFDARVGSTYSIFFAFSSSSSSGSTIRISSSSMRRICLGSVPDLALLS